MGLGTLIEDGFLAVAACHLGIKVIIPMDFTVFLTILLINLRHSKNPNRMCIILD